ncbi:MAG: DegV family protein [Streptococcaceae bacterium]|jgi:DegV family protein with EDD domain|nr:DegV family protein [Streptococcaceae bacterium]
MTLKIVTDSTITIAPELIEDLGITIVPLSFSIDGVIYTDGDLSLADYMNKVDAAENLPKTSQPPVGIFADMYQSLVADGSSVLSIHMTDTLSGTVEAARQGAMLTDGTVEVVDSFFTDQGLAFQVLEAARLAKAGKELPEVLSAIAQVRENTRLWAGVATLENLIKGGRIGRVTGMIGNFLDLKVILELDNKELKQIAKGRGNKTFKKWLDETAEAIAASGRKVKEIGISHVENLEFAETMRATLQKFVEKPIQILETTPIIATHTGRGAWALMFYYE